MHFSVWTIVPPANCFLIFCLHPLRVVVRHFCSEWEKEEKWPRGLAQLVLTFGNQFTYGFVIQRGGRERVTTKKSERKTFCKCRTVTTPVRDIAYLLFAIQNGVSTALLHFPLIALEEKHIRFTRKKSQILRRIASKIESLQLLKIHFFVEQNSLVSMKPKIIWTSLGADSNWHISLLSKSI